MDPQDQSPQPQLPPDDKPGPAPEVQGQAEDGSEAPPASRLSRRSFVLRAMTVLGAAAVAIVAVPAGAFMSAPGWLSTAPKRLLSHTVSPALRSDEWTSAGPIEKLRIGQPKHMIIDRPIVDGWVKRDAPVGVYVLRESDSKATVLDPHCTHLGCPVEFSSGSGSFLCPCHGGSFDPEGYPTSGPPPRRMDVYETRVEDGEVVFRHLLDPE
jgi:menaquinol-cytochrome c reductase iron-sulfur subunit